RLPEKDRGKILDHRVITLAVRRDPDSWRQAHGLNVRRELVHAAGKFIAHVGPIAGVNAARSLPAIVYLNVLRSVVLEVLRDPTGILLDLCLINLLIVVIPGAPT